jgi:hypothetical protein
MRSLDLKVPGRARGDDHRNFKSTALVGRGAIEAQRRRHARQPVRPQSRARALRGYHVAADASRGELCKEAQQKIRQEQANAAIAGEQKDVMPGYAKIVSAHE